MIEVFKTLMSMFVVLVVLNIALSMLLWRATNSKAFLLLTLHWFIELITFYIAGALAQETPILRILIPQLPAFFGVYTLALVLAQTLDIKMPLKWFAIIPFVNIALIYPLNATGLSPAIIALPLAFGTSFNFFYVAYKAVRYHRPTLTMSMWMIITVYVLYGIHFFDYGYFLTRFDLLVMGFTWSLLFHIAISMLVPAMLLEMATKEKAKVETEMLYKTRLMNTSKMLALGELAGGVAHEINTPLTMIQLLTDKINSKLEEDPLDRFAIHKSVALIQKSVNHTSKVIQGLKAFSKRENHGDKTSVSVKDLVKNTLDLCRERLTHQGIKLNINLPEKEVVIYSREVEISQVLLNLLNNASDAIENLPTKWIEISCEEKIDAVELRVTDSGTGIPEEVRDKVFQPFFTTKAPDRGTGLGLSLSHGIILAHKGSLTVDAEAVNTSFVISLPKA